MIMKCISVRLYFFGVFWEFLKIGKLTSRSLKGHGPRSPCRSNIAIIKVNGQKQVKMTIIQSQTEPFDQSATLFLLKNGGGGGLAYPLSSVIISRDTRTGYMATIRFISMVIPWRVFSSYPDFLNITIL